MLKVDVTVIGSGFSGSILAWVLASRGLSVVLVDRAKHPRFAIGESSTPIADSILRQLAEDYQIPVLHELSCWGSWQESHPDLPCGRKRGFSYLLHEKGKAFGEDAVGQKSLLVAASPTDFQSDTHWHRASFDTFLWRNAIQAGARDLTGYEVSGIDLRSRTHRIIHCQRSSQINDEVDAVSIASDWVVDASGSSSVFSQLLRVEDWTDQLKTKTHSTFAHYRGVKSWEEVISEPQRLDFKNPFSADDAAQHHLLNDGWMWMLRFNHGVTSVGYTTAMQNDLPSMESLRSDYP
ncbi:MAG: NAD(P)/FAD-dependent oxidoreductase, partial [Rubripirellula sp.]